jgi:hypothetical protein
VYDSSLGQRRKFITKKTVQYTLIWAFKVSILLTYLLELRRKFTSILEQFMYFEYSCNFYTPTRSSQTNIEKFTYILKQLMYFGYSWNFYTTTGSSLTDIEKFTSIFEQLTYSIFMGGNHRHRNHSYGLWLRKLTNATYN